MSAGNVEDSNFHIGQGNYFCRSIEYSKLIEYRLRQKLIWRQLVFKPFWICFVRFVDYEYAKAVLIEYSQIQLGLHLKQVGEFCSRFLITSWILFKNTWVITKWERLVLNSQPTESI